MTEVFTVSPMAFYILALVVVVSAIYAVTASKLLNAALVLALCFFAVGGLYYLLGAGFLGVLQVLINAGAIPIVTVFIIMMTQSRQSRLKLNSVPFYIVAAGILMASAAIFVPKISDYQGKVKQNLINNDQSVQQAHYAAQNNDPSAKEFEESAIKNVESQIKAASTTVNPASTKQIGNKLLSSPETNGQPGSLLPFEIASIILLVAMVGAIVLAKRDGEVIKGEINQGKNT